MCWNENEDLSKCTKCHASTRNERMNTQGDCGIDTNDEDCTKIGRASHLVIHHFSLTHKLKRMCICSKLAEHMR